MADQVVREPHAQCQSLSGPHAYRSGSDSCTVRAVWFINTRRGNAGCDARTPSFAWVSIVVVRHSYRRPQEVPPVSQYGHCMHRHAFPGGMLSLRPLALRSPESFGLCSTVSPLRLQFVSPVRRAIAGVFPVGSAVFLALTDLFFLSIWPWRQGHHY